MAKICKNAEKKILQMIQMMYSPAQPRFPQCPSLQDLPQPTQPQPVCLAFLTLMDHTILQHGQSTHLQWHHPIVLTVFFWGFSYWVYQYSLKTWLLSDSNVSLLQSTNSYLHGHVTRKIWADSTGDTLQNSNTSMRDQPYSTI